MRRRARTLRDKGLAPCVIKHPAEDGWRIVWIDMIDSPPGVVELRPLAAVRVEPITFWGMEGPIVGPSRYHGHESEIESTLGQPAPIVPLFGPLGERMPARVKIFRIVNPTITRTDESLIEEASDWLRDEHGVDRVDDADKVREERAKYFAAFDRQQRRRKR